VTPRLWRRTSPVNVHTPPVSGVTTAATQRSSDSAASRIATWTRSLPPATGGISTSSSPATSTWVSSTIAWLTATRKWPRS